jgi:hypothetical protein
MQVNGPNGLYDLTCDGQEDPILQDAIDLYREAL